MIFKFHGANIVIDFIFANIIYHFCKFYYDRHKISLFYQVKFLTLIVGWGELFYYSYDKLVFN